MTTQSKYPHGHAYDLFVSYSSRDIAWVKPFHDDLIHEVNRWTDPDIHPFLDRISIAPGDIWDDKIMAAVTGSAVLVPVMTPRFFSSGYCQQEVEAFTGAHGLDRNRIMPVQLLEAAPLDHILNKAQATAFSRPSDDRIAREFTPGSPDYKDALTKLGYAIAKALQNLPPKRNGRAAVFLAADFTKESDKLRASLSHHFDVLPQDPGEWLAYTAEELQQALTQNFARCFASIHRLGAEATFAKPLIDAQLAFARTQQKPRLVWTPDRPDDLTGAGFEWFTSAIEIEERIRRLHEKPGKLKINTSKTNGACIYFLCPNAANRQEAEPLLIRLKERGVNAYVSRLEGEAEQMMQDHVNLLDEADGCLIYYGNIGRAWFDGLYPRLRKKIRQRELRTVIYSGPPPNDHKRDLRFQDWTVVEDFDQAAEAFLESGAA